MLNYLITCSNPKLIEFARTWHEAQTLADAWNTEHSTCTIVIAEVLQIHTKGKKK